jgi:carbohydrate diacid regulator
MKTVIKQEIARKIVETVSEVCSHNINFIQPDGMILASTDAARENTFHEIGKKAADSKQTIEVFRNDRYFGTHEGVNIPIIYEGDVVAVIGITGDPDEVRKFAVAAERITLLLIREHYLERVDNLEKTRMNYILEAFAAGREVDRLYYDRFVRKYDIDVNGSYYVVLLQSLIAEHRKKTIPMENRIHEFFDSVQICIYTFTYPDTYMAVIPCSWWTRIRGDFEAFAAGNPDTIRISVGTRCAFEDLKSSYSSAIVAQSALLSGGQIAVIDEMDLGIITGSLSRKARSLFVSKTIGKLSENEIELLKTYFDTGMSLKETCETLYRHKNTVQYQLNRIAANTGYNPRSFKDAAVLYLALTLQRKKDS